MTRESVAELFDALGLQVLERGWLSSNNIVFRATSRAPATVVDTGYATHAGQTTDLIERSLGSAALGRVINTHLHSDHCGGNAALHARWDCDIVVPEPSFEIVRSWDEHALSFAATDQRCERFPVHAALGVNEPIWLGTALWEVYTVGGHDPDAVVLFQPESRVLISGDALWENRVAIVFPELFGAPGFQQALDSLNLIEALSPHVVIPGHGAPFNDVSTALANSRLRLKQFQEDPARHLDYARRALVMFHMFEHRRRNRADLIAWAESRSLLQTAERPWAAKTLNRLSQNGLLERHNDWFVLPHE